MGTSRRTAWELTAGSALLAILLTPWAAGSQQTAAQWLSLGHQQAAEGRYGPALEAYRQAATRDPGSAPAAYGQGWCLYHLGRLPEAEAALRRALELEPGHREATLTLAEVYLSQGRGQPAEALLRPLHQADTGDYLTTVGLGRALLYQRRATEARPLLEQAVRQRPDQPRPRVLLARIHRGRGEAEHAEALLLEALALEPGFEPAARDLLELYLATGRAQAARPLIRGLLLRYPQDRALLQAEAQAARALGRAEELRAALERLVPLLPASEALEARHELARSYLQAGRDAQAEAHLRVLLRARPRDPEALALLAQVLLRGGQTAEAEALLQRLAEIAPDQAPVYLHLARLRLEAGDAASAHAHARQALALQPGNAGALRLAREAAGAQGEASTALSYDRRLLALDPADPLARRALAEQLTRTGNLGEAAVQYHLLRTDPEPGGPDPRLALTALAAAAGNRDWQLALRREMAAEDPAQAPALVALLLEADRHREAEQALSAALAQRPEDTGLLTAQARLRRLRGDYAAAHAAVDTALSRAPGHAPAHRERGLALVAQDRAAEALASLRTALLDDPLCAEAYPALVRCAAALPHPQPVVDLLLALATNPAAPPSGTSRALAALAQVWEQQLGSEAAARELAHLAQVTPHHAELALQAGHQARRAGLTAQAAARYEQAAQQPAYAGRGLRLAVMTHLLARDYPRLLAASQEYLLREARDADAVALMAAVRATGAEPSEAAVAALVSLVNCAPHSAAYHRYRVGLFDAQGRLPLLQSHYQAQTDSLVNRLARAEIALRRGEVQPALLLLEEARLGLPPDPAAAEWLARLLRQSGQPQRGRETLEQVVRGADPGVALERAWCLLETGSAPQAVAEVTRALAQGADPAAAGELLERARGESEVSTALLLEALAEAYARRAEPGGIRDWVRKHLPQEDPDVARWLAQRPVPDLPADPLAATERLLDDVDVDPEG